MNNNQGCATIYDLLNKVQDRLMKFEHEPKLWNGIMVYEATDLESFLKWLGVEINLFIRTLPNMEDVPMNWDLPDV